MTDLAITATQVQGDQNLQYQKQGISTVTITPGQVLYYDSSDGKLKLASATAGGGADPSTPSIAVGISVNSTSPGQVVTYQYDGEITLGAGAAPAVGTVYCLSATAGGIAPVADLASGKYMTILGIGKTGNKLDLRGLFPSGIVKA
jgi:hypothetical protein